jgi:hypothetical protein
MKEYLHDGGDIGDQGAHDLSDPYDKQNPKTVVTMTEGWGFEHGGYGTKGKQKQLRDKLYFIDNLVVDHIIADANGRLAKAKGLSEVQNRKTGQVSYRAYRSGRFVSLENAPMVIGPENLPQMETESETERASEPLSQMEETEEEE